MMSKEGQEEPESHPILHRDLLARRNKFEAHIDLSIAAKKIITGLSVQLQALQLPLYQTHEMHLEIKRLESKLKDERVKLVRIDKATYAISEGIIRLYDFIETLKKNRLIKLVCCISLITEGYYRYRTYSSKRIRYRPHPFKQCESCTVPRA
jgi:hypothetical protein